MKYYFDFNQRSIQISTFTLICEHPMKVKVRAIAPERNCLPIPKLTLSQTLTLTGEGGNFSRGQLSGCPLTLKLNLTLTQTLTLTEGNFPRGAIVQIPWKTYFESKNKKYITKHKKVTLFILSNKLFYLIYLGFPWIWKFRKHQRWQKLSMLDIWTN